MEALAIGAQGLLAGIIFLGLAPERLARAKSELAARPFRSLGVGALGFVGTLSIIVVACVTIIGIPIGILLALALPLAAVIGLGVTASVVGAVIPVVSLRSKPIHQIAAGAGSLMVAALVPILGAVVGLCATLAGVGALLATHEGRFGRHRPHGPRVSSGPYRTAGYSV